MSVTHVAGCDIHWTELGAGPPIVLLHGLCDSQDTWSKAAPLLATKRRVLMLDLAGHGRSSRPDATYALEWHAHVVGAWLEALDLQSVDVVGHSYGGGVAMMLLLAHRARIRRLALVAAGGLGRDVSLALRLASIPQVVERLGQPFMARGTRMALNALGAAYDHDEVESLASMNAVKGTARAFARSVRDVIDWRGQHRHLLDGSGNLGTLPPIALYWGEHDLVIPFAHATRTTSFLEGAPLMRFAGCGHFPHRQQHTAFVHALEAFLDPPSAAGSRLRAAA